MENKKIEIHTKLLLTSAVLFFIAWLCLGIINLPQLAGALGLTAASSEIVVNLIGAYSTVTTVISIIGVVTGVGSIGSGIAATVLFLIKKKGKAEAALW